LAWGAVSLWRAGRQNSATCAGRTRRYTGGSATGGVLGIVIESSLFYSLFGTVAQTLFGAMGLLAAIVLFYLQNSSQSISHAAEKLSELDHPDVSQLYIRHLFTSHNFHEIARLYGALLEGQHETSRDLLVYHSTLAWELQQEEHIRRSFWRLMVGSGLVTSWSILGLAIVPLLMKNLLIGILFLISSVVGAFVSFFLFAVMLRVMVRKATREDLRKALKS
jgi:hypothetical protein